MQLSPLIQNYHPSSGLILSLREKFLSKHTHWTDEIGRMSGNQGAERGETERNLAYHSKKYVSPISHCPRIYYSPAEKKACLLVHVCLLTWRPWPALLNSSLIKGYRAPSFLFHSQHCTGNPLKTWSSLENLEVHEPIWDLQDDVR